MKNIDPRVKPGRGTFRLLPCGNGRGETAVMAQREPSSAGKHRWIGYGLAALAIHAALLTLPMSGKVHHKAEGRPIDVVVMRQEPVHAALPARIERRKPLSGRPALRRIVPNQKAQARQVPEAAEKKDEPPSSGAGNVLDERIVPVAAPALEGDGGVATAGANERGSTVGPGAGGTGIGAGTAGTGTGTAVGGKGTDNGPADARFGDADGPQFVYRERPEYPFAAMRLQKEGKVTLCLTIDEKGKLEKVEVVEATDEMFASSAVEAIRRSKLRPARQNGVPVRCRAPYTIRFGF
jgi:TonB family protein